MILIDANLLLYAKVADYPQHRRAHAWLEARLNAPGRVGMPWPSLLAFLRLITNPRLFETPLSMDQAWAQVEEWLALPIVWVPAPTDRHAAILSQLLQSTSVVANLVSDAHQRIEHTPYAHWDELDVESAAFTNFKGEGGHPGTRGFHA